MRFGCPPPVCGSQMRVEGVIVKADQSPLLRGLRELACSGRQQRQAIIRGSMDTHLSFNFVMTEHPSWMPSPAGQQRIVTVDGCLWLVRAAGASLDVEPIGAAGSRPPRRDVFVLRQSQPGEVAELATALGGLGPVLRIRNEDLWDALGTAILRQVIRASQSKRLYRAFCAAHGRTVLLPGGEQGALFPTWSQVLALGDEDFGRLGLAFKRRPLRQAAEAFGSHGSRWASLPPATLVEELQRVPGIGAWTAGAAVADWSNDWTLYPYADLAVRTWARRAAPGHAWPDGETRFGGYWRSLTADLSALTVLTLAWGSQHGDIG